MRTVLYTCSQSEGGETVISPVVGSFCLRAGFLGARRGLVSVGSVVLVSVSERDSYLVPSALIRVAGGEEESFVVVVARLRLVETRVTLPFALEVGGDKEVSGLKTSSMSERTSSGGEGLAL